MLYRCIEQIRRGNSQTVFLCFMILFFLNKLLFSNTPPVTHIDTPSCIDPNTCIQEYTSYLYTIISYFSLNAISWHRLLYWGVTLCIWYVFGRKFFYTSEAMVSFITQISLLMFLDLFFLFFLTCFMFAFVCMSIYCSVYTIASFFKTAPREIKRNWGNFPKHTKRIADKITGHNIDLYKCVLDVSNVVVGESSCLSINLINGKRESYKFKKDDVFMTEVTWTSNNQIIPVVIEPTDLTDTTSIRVSFTCYTAGEYSIKATINSRDFPKTPIFHCAVADKPDPGHSLVDLKSDCLVVGEHEQSSITVLPRDQYDNEAAMLPEKLKLIFLDTEEPAFSSSVERDLTIYLTVLQCGVFRCCIQYDGVVVGSGEFFVIVLTIMNLSRLENDIQNDNPLSITVSISNLESKQTKKKIQCQVTPKQLTFTEYFLIFFPSRFATFRMRPATKIMIDNNSNSVCINDGKQDQMNVLFSLEENRQLFIAYFNKFLLKNLGGSSDFEEKKTHFYQKLKVAVSKNRHGTHYITIDRENLLKNMINHSKDFSPSQWHKKWYVEFKGEEGMDYGGVSRELFGVLSRHIFTPTNDNQFFVYFEGNANPLSHPNPAIDLKQSEQVYILIGRLIGKCLIESACGNPIFLEARLTRSFLAQLLGLRVCATYFATDDKALYRGKIQYMNESNNVEELEQYFVEEELGKDGSVLKTVPLKPGGADILVTQTNKLQYLDLLANYRLCKRVSKQIELVCRGLYELIPDTLLSVFDESEFELLICGITTYDIKEWKDSINICTTDRQVFPNLLSWFWTLAESLPQAGRARIVQFTTGSGQLPPGGFDSLSPRFQIGLSPSSHKLPTAHTCFNQLLLPNHSTYEEFRCMFNLAMKEGAEGFGMV
ncbi:Apoptosis-resistant E3 ubiquitin protein ligase 1 isoform X2 [Oopsacas minuta]|uniref:HECT-type E3 ubiquitin transferase n=1 Tax=Oopsacas minuta TaxID=111878 RepID=A0AAV7K9X6_9METZ|nr:Apoptosis-resistant E3 ubiquitin protein ligase 1 isoform X2 [Oopsacas minuta]